MRLIKTKTHKKQKWDQEKQEIEETHAGNEEKSGVSEQ
jgi:hypothetical protein